MLHAFLNVIFLDNRVRRKSYASCDCLVGFFGRDVTLLCVGTFYSCNGMYVPNFCNYEISKWTPIKLKITKVNLLEILVLPINTDTASWKAINERL